MNDARTPQRSRRSPFLGIATALMCALAGGAVWCLLSLYERGDLAGFAFVVALPVAWSLRYFGFGGTAAGAVIAALCVLLASAYSFCLQAVARIAAMLGVPMRDALWKMGGPMTIDVALAHLGTTTLAITIAAAILAAALVARRRTPRG